MHEPRCVLSARNVTSFITYHCLAWRKGYIHYQLCFSSEISKHVHYKLAMHHFLNAVIKT
jgi:hypothetical protein